MSHSPLELSVAMAKALVQRSMTKIMWEAYKKVLGEWESVVESVGADIKDRESCMLYFVERSHREGISTTRKTEKLSALAFWFRFRGVPDVTNLS